MGSSSKADRFLALHVPGEPLLLPNPWDLGSARQLETMGYRPSILFIPYGPIQLKFIRSLFGRPSYEVEGRHEYGSDHLGTWKGLEVFSWAFTNPDSILIADGTALFGLSELAENGKFGFEVENKDSMKHQQMLKKAEETNDPDKIARPSDVRVLSIGRLVPALGLRGTRAAIRMPIDLEKLGYAILAGDTYYHRPGCHLLEGKEVQYSLSNLLDSGERARSCLTCRPYEWDHGSD